MTEVHQMQIFTQLADSQHGTVRDKSTLVEDKMP
jgi:hypothetical protein